MEWCIIYTMEIKNRYLCSSIINDLSEKMVFIGGPRQIGKTTLARDLIASHFHSFYYNWDKIDQRKKALNGQWDPNAELIILDEFHKHPKWKSWIKGEYDVYKNKYKFLLAGSARLNIYRKGGDSLQGRYHYYTLYPFSYGELLNNKNIPQPGGELSFDQTDENPVFENLMKYGGFPEPLIRQNPTFHRRWLNERIERFFKEDVRELTMLKDFGSLSLLAHLLPEKVGSILSINSLSTDLQITFKTVSNWLDVFENFYYCFRIPPYQTRKFSAVKKEKKLYLWDWSEVKNESAKIENFAALHLLKLCSYLNETEGWNVSLTYLRDITGREVDFLVTFDDKPWFAVEVKTQDRNISKHLYYFKEKLGIPYIYQLAYRDDNEDYVKDNLRVMPLKKFFSGLV